MKRLLSMLLSFILLLGLTACGGTSTPSPESQVDQIEDQEAELSPKEKAKKTDQILNTLVTVSTASYNEMLDYLAGFGTAYNADNLISYAKTAISEGYDYLEGIEDLPDQENSSDYQKAADAYITNVLAAWISLRDYLEKGDQEKYDHLKGCVQMEQVYSAQFSEQRIDYLTNAGFTEQEINDLLSTSSAG